MNKPQNAHPNQIDFPIRFTHSVGPLDFYVRNIDNPQEIYVVGPNGDVVDHCSRWQVIEEDTWTH